MWEPALSSPMENVERITFGSAIADILALANAGIFVASGSSFSMWAIAITYVVFTMHYTYIVSGVKNNMACCRCCT